jgi:hypothetical protein
MTALAIANGKSLNLTTVYSKDAFRLVLNQLFADADDL